MKSPLIAFLCCALPGICNAQTVTISDASVQEGGLLKFTLTLDQAVNNGVNVQATFTANTALGDGIDFSSMQQTVSFDGNSGESKIITVATTQDVIAEGEEQLSVSLFADSPNVNAQDMATGIITDDDVAYVTVNNAVANEGDYLEFTVSLDKAVKTPFTVSLSASSSISNTTGSDFPITDRTVLFNGSAGETHTVRIPTEVDKVPDEGSEAITVSLTNPLPRPYIDVTSTGVGIINDFTECRYCPSKVYLDTVEQFNITFFGDGNLQSSVQSGDELAATTGIGVIIDKHFSKLHKQRFGPWYKIELMAQINIASSIDTIEAKYKQLNGARIMENTSTFGNAILTPLNSGQAVDLRLRLYNKVSYFGFLTGFESRYIGSNRTWKLSTDTVGSINTNLFRASIFHDLVPYDKRHSFSVMAKVGYAANWVRGDLGSRKNDAIRSKFLGTGSRTFHGIELGIGLKLRNIQSEFAYTIFPEDANVAGLTGSRLVTTIKFVGGFNLEVD